MGYVLAVTGQKIVMKCCILEIIGFTLTMFMYCFQTL